MSKGKKNVPDSKPMAQTPQKPPFLGDILTPEMKQEVVAQAKSVVPSAQKECTQEERIECALKYGPQAIDNRILASISENINKMAEAINESEAQKSTVRDEYVNFFKWLLIILLVFCGTLICADTFYGFHVRTEFLISAVVAVIADVIAIVHTLVNYMTNVEHYTAYNKMIESLLKHINHNPHYEKSPSDPE